MLALAAQPSAAASVMWCRSDPLVIIDGYVVDVFVGIPVTDLPKVTGATEIVVTTPPGVGVALAAPGVGFGYGEDVTFGELPSLDVDQEGMQIRVKVLVPTTDDAVPVQVQLAPRVVGILSPATAEGQANAWVAVRTTI
jgi:hypothetical protein